MYHFKNLKQMLRLIFFLEMFYFMDKYVMRKLPYGIIKINNSET